MRKLIITFGVFSVAAMASATAASAKPPERFNFTESGTEVLLHCDGFDGNLDTTGTFDGTAFFDKSGDPVKFIIRGRITETITNSVTGKTMVNRGVFQDMFRRIDGTDDFTHSVVGYDFQGKIGGRGPVVLRDVGRKVFDPETGEIVFRAGQPNIPPEDAEAEAFFCAALA
jgi:hypothetical protein